MSRRATRWGAALVAAAALLALAWLVGRALWPTAGARPPGARSGPRAPSVEVEAARSRTIDERIPATGTLVGPEAIEVAAEQPGRVAEVRFREGQPVERGDVLVVLEREPEVARLEQARTRVAETGSDLERQEELHARGFASQATLDAARTAHATAEAELRAISERLGDRSVAAPFAGVTGRRLVSPGTYLSPGDPITALFETETLDLLFEVPGNLLGRIEAGMRVVARTAAYPDRTFTGEVEFVGTEVDAGTRTLPLEATLPNEDGALKPGMFIELDLVVDERTAVTVPESALVSRGPTHFVYRLDAGEDPPVARRVTVTPGTRRSGWIEIGSGLDAGDRVVVAGLQKVRDGMPVRLAPQAATAGGPDPGGGERDRGGDGS